MENFSVTHDNLPSVVSQLFKKVSNIESLLLMQSEKAETPQNVDIPMILTTYSGKVTTFV